MKEIIPKSYQGTKPDIIAGVTDKPRSERLWRSKKSPPHPETVARRDPGVSLQLSQTINGVSL